MGSVIRAGARGYVTKTITSKDLIASVRQVADGYAVFSPKLAGFVLTAFTHEPVPSPASSLASAGAEQSGSLGAPGSAIQSSGNQEYSPDDIDVLSPREQEVMRLIARGYSYKEVASELFISVKTVETHVSAVLRKLQLSNRGELARWAAHRRIV